MKKIALLTSFLAILLLFLCFTNSSFFTSQSEKNIVKYYTQDSFNSLTIKESTYHDLCKIAPPSEVYVTSYGIMCKYPMSDGNYIYVKMYGNESAIWEIEISS